MGAVISVLLGNGVEKVIHAGPSGRDQQLIATIPAPDVTIDDGTPAGVVLDSSFYFLDPVNGPGNGGIARSTRLHRVTQR